MDKNKGSSQATRAAKYKWHELKKKSYEKFERSGNRGFYWKKDIQEILDLMYGAGSPPSPGSPGSGVATGQCTVGKQVDKSPWKPKSRKAFGN